MFFVLSAQFGAVQGKGESDGLDDFFVGIGTRGRSAIRRVEAVLRLHVTVGIHGQNGAAVDEGIVIAASAGLEAVHQPHAAVAHREGIDVIVAADDGLGAVPRQDLLKEAVVCGVGADALVEYTEGILVAGVPAAHLLAGLEGHRLGIHALL